MKILVACPVHESKEDTFARYVETTRALTHRDLEFLCVDNSPTSDFCSRWANQIPMLHQPVVRPEALTNKFASINECAETIRERFLAGTNDYWFSTGSDMIYPASIIETLLHWGRDADWIGHAFRMRDSKDYTVGVSCSLLSRKLMENFSFVGANEDSYDVHLWEQVRRRGTEFKTVELWGIADVGH